MKYPLSLSLLLAGAMPVQPALAALDQAAYVSLAASVLRVEVPRQRGGYALGSAVAIAPDKVVTNCHVTRDAQEIHVLRGGLRWPVQWQASDVARDLCLLQVPGLGAQPAALGHATTLTIGQQVTALGYTGGLGIQNSAGEVVQLHRFDGGRVIQSTNWFSSGASGGGLFDDAGRLVGILTFRLRGGESHYFAAPVEWVEQMLSDTQRGSFRKVMPLDSQPLPYWQATPSAQPRFLKAAVLVRNDRWGELESLAAEWSRSEPDDAEPWYLLGTALDRLGRPAEARRALECSLSLEPARAAASERLADVAARAPSATPSPKPCSSDRP
jgi:S1-C subfamily serine protease